MPCSAFQRMTALTFDPPASKMPEVEFGDRDDACAALLRAQRGDGACIPEALDDDGCLLARSMPSVGARLIDAEDGAAGGRLVAALRAAQRDRLAGDDTGHRVARRAWSTCPSSRP